MTRWSWLCAEREDQDSGLDMICLEDILSLKGCFFGSVMYCLSSRAWEKGRKSFLIQVSLFLRWSWVAHLFF